MSYVAIKNVMLLQHETEFAAQNSFRLAIGLSRVGYNCTGMNPGMYIST
jgi:hypothetical protein